MKKLFLVMIAVMFVFSLVYSGDFTYIGSQKCKMCHKGEKKGMVFEKWDKSPHAKAFETLKAKGDEGNAECLGCHATNGDAALGAVEGVGCEACHGPGSDYKKMSTMKDRALAVAAGMLVPDEAACKKCHNEKSPTFKGFDFAKYWEKINHKYR